MNIHSPPKERLVVIGNGMAGLGRRKGNRPDRHQFAQLVRGKRYPLFTGDPIISISGAAHTVTSKNGRVAPYDRLLVATGSRPIVPPISGLNLQGV